MRKKPLRASVFIIVIVVCMLALFHLFGISWLYNSCRLHGTLPSFPCMIRSLRRHRLPPSSSSCARLDGSLTFAVGYDLGLFRKVSPSVPRKKAHLGGSYVSPLNSLLHRVLADGSKQCRSTPLIPGILHERFNRLHPIVPYASTACSSSSVATAPGCVALIHGPSYLALWKPGSLSTMRRTRARTKRICASLVREYSELGPRSVLIPSREANWVEEREARWRSEDWRTRRASGVDWILGWRARPRSISDRWLAWKWESAGQ